MKHKATTAGTTRIVFLDYLRVLACLMVIATHSCDSFYIGPGGVWQCASESDRLWISIIDSIMRAAVPLFVMTSSYLLLPLKDDNTTFFKRRFIRVLVPFAVWSCIYAFWPVLMGDLPASELPMRLIGLYLFMPVLSPWLKQTGKKAELAFLAVWFVSSFLAYLKEIGAGDMFGECYWNEFHSFWYFSGFIGYLVLAHYIRHHLHWNASRSLGIGLLCFLAGYAVTAIPFLWRLPAAHHRALLRLFRHTEGHGTGHTLVHPDADPLYLRIEQPHHMAAVQASFREIPCRINILSIRKSKEIRRNAASPFLILLMPFNRVLRKYCL